MPYFYEDYDEYCSYEEMMAADDGFCYRLDFGSPSYAMDTIRDRPHGFEHCPESLKTQAMCYFAVAAIPENLRYVPDEFKTREMCESAVAALPDNIRDVPVEFKTREMCEYAVTAKPENIMYVPDEFKTREMCESVIAELPWMLSAVPDEFKTREMCEHAFEYDYNALNYIPDHFRTSEMCYKVGFEDAVNDRDTNHIIGVITHARCDDYTLEEHTEKHRELLEGIGAWCGRPDRQFSICSGEYTSDMLKGLEEDQRSWYTELVEEAKHQLA